MKDYITKIMMIVLQIMIFCNIVFAQQTENKAVLQGIITDKDSDKPLMGVHISVRNMELNTVSDTNGRFVINVPSGNKSYLLDFFYEGYSKMFLNVKDTEKELHVRLSSNTKLLGEVVVSATRNETDKKEAPIIVNIASAELFETTSSCNLKEVMGFQPGLRVENNCGNCGTSQLRINGLEGQYSQILIDSRPVFSSLASVYGLEQFPVDMIERVEIIRGGGSALFGSNAIGGIVNIITKEPLRNSVMIANTTNMLTINSFDINTSLNSSFVSNDHKAGIYIFGMLKNRHSYDRNQDGFSDIPKLNTENIGFRGFYNTSNYSQLIAEFHHIHEFRRGGNMFDNPPHESDIAEYLNHKIDGGSLRFKSYSSDYKHNIDMFVSGQLIDRDSYFGAEKGANAYGKTNDKTFAAGTKYSFNMEKLLFLPAQLTAGIEYNFNTIHDKFAGLGRNIEQITHIFGAYLQNEWKNKYIGLLFGARLDKHNIMKNAVFSPRINMRYSPCEKIGFRVSYSSGYRAPQTYNEDLHIEAVGGSLTLIQLANNLRPEYSHSINASVDFYHNFGDMKTNLLLEGFYTTLNDVFVLENIGQDTVKSIIYKERRNGSGATVYGVNIEGKIGIDNIFDIQLGYTLQSSLYNNPERWSDQLTPQRRIFRTPDYYGYITSNFYITQSFRASFFGNHTGSMLVQHTISEEGKENKELEVITPAFWDFGLKLAYNFPIADKINFEINGGVKNIFDAYQKDLDYGKLKDAAYVYGPSLPRMFFIGAKIYL
ncbi:TonB-dependent receptor [Porphyromonadaceae bacterium COT-184 OH4590]|nr:TonB-dependent receptor [Porphyromonadaceae bacterium COT-184 OH4590]